MVSKPVYLNNAATSWPKPRLVQDAVAECIRNMPFHADRTGFEQSGSDPVRECRVALSTLLNTETPDSIYFTSNATESLNLAINGLPLVGKHVVTTATEHNSVLRPLRHLEAAGTISLTIIPCDAEGKCDLQQFSKAICADTAAVVVNHCSNVTGAVQDIPEICHLCKAAGITVVLDASQSAGAIPVDLKGWGVDILAFTGHKSLFGIQGIGGIHVSEKIRLSPLKTGGTGVRSDLPLHPEDHPFRYEAGTHNMPGIVSLLAGIRFIEEYGGVEAVHGYKVAIMKQIIEGLDSIKSVRIIRRSSAMESGTALSFRIDGISTEDAGYSLENVWGIVLRSGLHCAPLIHYHIGTAPEGTIRVSPSVFTTEQEIEAFIQAVRELASTV